MKSKLINYEIFIEKRPDMEVHTEASINSCINSAYVLLDGECASLISKVEQFNYNESGIIPDRDKNDILYRTDFELGQLQEALVFQVQYVLNMGNDFTIGGGSYSIGNVNSSYNRPEGRELIAHGVYKLLSNARVYNLNAFGSFNQKDPNNIPLSTSKEIMERVKNEYVAINQPNAQVGQVAYVNQSNQVDFGNPEDLQITTYNTQRIAGPEGYRTNYYRIDNVPNIAFFGPDMDGTFSAVHREEMVEKIQGILDITLTKEEIYNAIYASGIEWKPAILYRKGWIVQRVNELNYLLYFECLKDNINKDPLDPNNEEYWKKLTTQEIDLNLIVEQLKSYIDQQLPPLVKEEVDKQLNELPTTNYIQETKDQVLSFVNQTDYEAYKKANNLIDDDFEDIQVDTSNIAYKNKQNKFTEYQHILNGALLGYEENQGYTDISFGSKSQDNDYYTTHYLIAQRNNNKLIANSNEAQEITNEKQLTTKEYVDNQVKTKLQINNLPNELNYYFKEFDLPSNKNNSVILFNDCDTTKIVSLTLWFKRSNNGPWINIPNEDSDIEKGANPFTIESANNGTSGELRMWRIAETSSTRWVKGRISIIYNGTLE